MKFLQKTSAICSLALLPSLVMAECKYNDPDYQPTRPAMGCQVPDGVYSMANRLSGAGIASNYTVLLFVDGNNTHLLVKDKTAEDKDFLVTPKKLSRRSRPREAGSEADAQNHHGDMDYYPYPEERHTQSVKRRHHGSGSHGGWRIERHPKFCQGNKINMCFGPDTKRAVAMPETLQGSIDLTINENKDTLSGKIILDGSITSTNTVVLRKQNQETDQK